MQEPDPGGLHDGLEDALEDIAAKVLDYTDSLTTEEATKTAIVLPFVSRVLGYDVFNPQEVVPEFIADFGIRKGEKIDFAVMRDGPVQMLIEAKKIGEPSTWRTPVNWSGTSTSLTHASAC